MIHTLILNGIISFLGAGVYCDPPVKLYFYVEQDSLQTMVRKHFPAAAEDFAKTLESAQKSATYERRPFFREGEKGISQVPEFDLFQGLMALIKPAVVQNETDKIDRFLADVTDAKLIQGYQLARRGGPFHVVLTLTADDKGFWNLSSQYRQFQVLDQYQGPVVFRSLEVRKTPPK